MIDPRPSVIEKRLSRIKALIAVSGGKGGVGKSTVACLLALFLSERKKKVGLLDLDFYGPSSHLILGIDGVKVEEEMGIIPPIWRGITYMSISLFTKGGPLPVRGKGTSNIFKELLSVTLWDELDFLILDMPPGTGEITLDVLMFLKDVKFLLVTTPFRTAQEVLKKEIMILKARNTPIIGVIENLVTDSDQVSCRWDGDVTVIGYLPYDSEFEKTLGSPDGILGSSLYASASQIFERIFCKDDV